MAKQVATDDWETLESQTNRGREGVFVSIAPSGRIAFSKDLTKRLDPKLPRCAMKYSISLAKLRLIFQREITVASWQWYNKGKDQSYLTAASALAAKNLIPEKVTLYPAVYEQPKDQPPYVEVDIGHPLLVVEPRPRKQKAEPPEEKTTPTAICAECGQKAETVIRGGTLLLKHHNDPSGQPCFCRRAKKASD